MTRRCSHCSNNGHNSRTCPTRAGSSGGATSSGGSSSGGVRLFGVRLNNEGSSMMKKSASMGNLSHYYSSPNPSCSSSSESLRDLGLGRVAGGYLSDDPNHANIPRGERKKGKPWTEDEHRLFLVGLQKLGKGDWRGIARNYVVSRTPTQVASHAQKYFIRQTNVTRRKRRSSLFDMVSDMVTEEPHTGPEDEVWPSPAEPRKIKKADSMPSLELSLSTDSGSIETTFTDEAKETRDTIPLQDNSTPSCPVLYLSVPYPFWTQNTMHPEEEDNVPEISNHQVLKPTPMLLKEPVNVDELVGMSELNLSETKKPHVVPPHLSRNLLESPSRQSAFHLSTSSSATDLNKGKDDAVQPDQFDLTR